MTAWQIELWDYDQLRVKSFIVATFEEVQSIQLKYKQSGLYIVKFRQITLPTNEIEE